MHGVGKVNAFYLYLRIYKLINNDNYKNLNKRKIVYNGVFMYTGILDYSLLALFSSFI
jgi:hypothetical protein